VQPNLPNHLYEVKNPEAGTVIYCGAPTAANAAALVSTKSPVEVKEMGFSDMRLRMGPAGANLVMSAINANWRVVDGHVLYPDSALGLGIVSRKLKKNA
jgi:hypothetical protein